MVDLLRLAERLRIANRVERVCSVDLRADFRPQGKRRYFKRAGFLADRIPGIVITSSSPS
jgi:hypothetical protein